MRLTILAAVLASLLHGNVHAAVVEVAGRAWNCDDGVSVAGVVATARTDGKGRKSAFLTTQIDVSQHLERGIEWHVRMRGRGIKKPAKPYLGVKAMLVYEDAGGDRRYPGPTGKTGDFDWITVRYRTAFRNGVRDGTAKLVLGLQETEGEVEYDLSSLRIVSAATPAEQIDDTRKCKYTSRVSALPQLRGVMSPSRPMTEDDFVKLHGWGVKLLRYQMNRFWNLHYANRDLKDYAKWLDSKLDHLDSTVLPLAAKYGIKVAIDLHMPPGGKASDGEMNMFYEPKYAAHFLACWQKIARRFRANPALYGYDIINEPIQTYSPANGLGWWGLQKKAAEVIRAIDPVTPIIVEANHADSPDGFAEMLVMDVDDVIYEVHLYSPMEFTHQGVSRDRPHVPTRWPDEAKGWNIDYLRQKLEKVREFQLKHEARIFLGEFSAVAWAEGADRWMDDAISIFNEYGWDWTYHAYGEFEGWSVEHEADKPYEFRPANDTPRKAALLRGLNDDVHSSSVPFTLEWKQGETMPVKVLDFGPDGVGGYPVVLAEAVGGKAQLRLSYGCVPKIGDGGDFSPTPSGSIRAEWRREGGKMTTKLSAPPNLTQVK